MEKQLYQCQIQKGYNFFTFPTYYCPETFMCFAIFFNLKDTIPEVPHCSR